jgi:hypothetical protein
LAFSIFEFDIDTEPQILGVKSLKEAISDIDSLGSPALFFHQTIEGSSELVPPIQRI